MKILITGGAGFIGSHLARLLLQQGHFVHLLDDLSTGNESNVKELLGPQCVLQRQDVGSAFGNVSWLADYGAIYHLAASVGVKLIVEEPVRTIENNVHNTGHVLRGAAAFHIPTLIASSSEVYGKSAQVPFKEDNDVTYGATIYSRWAYALTKALDEYLAMEYHRKHGLPTVVARFFNTVGPRQVGQFGMVLPRFIESALAGHPIEIHGDGKQTRCFCHVADVVNALPKLLSKKECWGHVYNLGSDREVSIEELANRVIALTGSAGGKRFIPYEDAFRRDFEDLRRRVPDLTRIHAAIGYKVEHNLDDIISELIELARKKSE